ncbi:MAG: tetratricopeptide repeat protein [Candidatus Obscuribacterales bacterium]|nr:tetratricopeptide repeat protein [Candidatus Obscuribacterales bacterium]
MSRTRLRALYGARILLLAGIVLAIDFASPAWAAEPDSNTPPSADVSGFELTVPVSDSKVSYSDLNLDTVSSRDIFESASQDINGGRLDAAEIKLKEVLRREPGNLSASNNLACVLRLKGNQVDALRELERRPGGNAVSICNMAACQIALGKYDDALSNLYRAIRLEPSVEAYRKLGHVLSLKGDDESAVAAYQQAIETFKASTAANDGTLLGDLHFDLGDCLRRVKRFDQALVEYRTAEKLCIGAGLKFSQDLKLRQAKCLDGLGRYEEARVILNELLEKNPDDTDSLNCLGVVLWQEKQVPESIYVLERALKIDPAYPQARNNLGIALYELKRYDEAVNVWKQALSLKADYPEAHYNIGVALYQSGLIEQAVEAYLECLRYAPRDASAHNNLGLAYMKLGKKEQAVAEWKKAIECNSECAEAYTNLGKILKESAKTQVR